MLGCFQLTARIRCFCLFSNSFGPFGGFPWEKGLGRVLLRGSFGASLGGGWGGPENAWKSSINGPDKVFLFVLKQFWAIWGFPWEGVLGRLSLISVSGAAGSTYQGRRHAAEALYGEAAKRPSY